MEPYIIQQNLMSKTVVKWWISIDEIIDENPSFKAHIILRNLNKNSKSGHGYIWTYYTPPEEQYQKLDHYPDFEISNWGNVKNNITNQQVQVHSYNGNAIVTIHDITWDTVTVKVSHLVAFTFLKNHPYFPVFENTKVYHKDLDTLNNIFDNLSFEMPNNQPFKINQINLETGKIINTFDSILAIEDFAINIDHVLDACNNVCSGTGGYGWEFSF